MDATKTLTFILISIHFKLHSLIKIIYELSTCIILICLNSYYNAKSVRSIFYRCEGEKMLSMILKASSLPTVNHWRYITIKKINCPNKNLCF